MPKGEWVFRLHWSDEDLPPQMGMEALPLRQAEWQGFEFRIIRLSYYLGVGEPEDPRKSLWLEIWEGEEMLERIGGREVCHLKSLAEEFVDRLLHPEGQTRLPQLYHDEEGACLSTKKNPKKNPNMMFRTSLSLAGTIQKALPLEQGQSKSGTLWRKQCYVLDISTGNYPKECCVAVWGDLIDQLNLSAYLGRDVLLGVDVESREFNGRYYTEIRATRLLNSASQGHPVGVAQTGGGQTEGGDAGRTAKLQGSPTPAQGGQPTTPVAPAPADDLPF